MAHWGIALTLLNNPHSAPPAPNLPFGQASIAKAKEIVRKTQRERDYIDALSTMYADYERVPHSQRVQSYVRAMAAVAETYPKDDEAQIAYAIALNVSAPPPPTRPSPISSRGQRSWSR